MKDIPQITKSFEGTYRYLCDWSDKDYNNMDAVYVHATSQEEAAGIFHSYIEYINESPHWYSILREQ